MSNIIASFEEVSYSYPKSSVLVLKNINLEIRKGEFFGLIGPTGAGKSTLCCAMNGIVPQFYGGRFFGRLTVAGMDSLDNPVSALAQHVGQVFEDPETQLITTSVENEIAFMLENLKIPREEIRRRIPLVLETVRLEGTEKKHPVELSGGQKQRLAIATALAAEPDLLVLDEPTSQLDPVGTEEVFSTVYHLNKELGMTILMASHSAEEMAQYADRIGLLSSGELICVGTPDEVYSQVALLQEHALRPPQVVSTFFNIRSRGIPVPKLPMRLDEGIETMRTFLNPQVTITPPAPFPEPEPKQGTPLVHIKDLVHVYPDGTEALHGVSVDIHTGEYVLIIGQNGAGKSTLVKHFLKLLKPSSGTVEIGGVSLEALSVSKLAANIGYIAQNPDSQIFNMSVMDEVSFALKNLNFSKDQVEARTIESLKSMGLYEFRDKHPLSLAKGDRARVVIAAILAMKPETIIFDEPTTGQDYRGAQAILDISRKLHQQGKTVVVITHHLYLMPEYAERVIVMGKGTVLMDAPIRDAFLEKETLESSFLVPPQAVQLSLALSKFTGKEFPLLTPSEVANCFSYSLGNTAIPVGRAR